MKYHIKSSQHGFAHPVLLVFLVVSVLGVVGFSGYRVMSRNRSVVDNAPVTQGQIVISPQSISTDTASSTTEAGEISIKSPGSAAEVTSSVNGATNGSAAPKTGKIAVSSQYDVSTPIGSLSQLIYEARKGDYGSALYFVTPQFVTKAYASVGAQSFDQFIGNCQSNEACSMLTSTTVNFDLSHITETSCTAPSGSGFAECKNISTKFVLEDNSLKTVYYKTVGYHVHSASVTLLRADNSTNWVINQISVDSFTL